ncbi:hypothetical protein [Williamsia deligens]|uniref:Phosphatidate cytidylyltransferase n=1 Tax=Williamsia deligens TaxID=321325 RepID=A0ABW3GB79_9NOCA|nr:hypothetical protein [Williamsia deligens]MCP2192313.1 hypothetical protein [Williamsia deligens]
MTRRNVLAATSTGTAALLVVALAAGAGAWLPIVLAVFLALELVALVLEVRHA